MSIHDEKEKATIEQHTESLVLVDEYLETIKRIDSMVTLFNEANEKNKKWLLYDFDMTKVQGINSNSFKNLIISYHIEYRNFYENYTGLIKAKFDHEQILQVSRDFQIDYSESEENIGIIVAKISELRSQRIVEQRIYLNILETKIIQKKRAIDTARRLNHSKLGTYMNDRKEMLSLRLKIKRDLALYDVVCQIEANTILQLQDQEGYFQVYDADINLIISRRPVIYLTNNNWHYLGNITNFDFDNFYKLLPQKYWIGLMRDRKIDSILNDLDD
jgi:lipoate-protein ligase B